MKTGKLITNPAQFPEWIQRYYPHATAAMVMNREFNGDAQKHYAFIVNTHPSPFEHRAGDSPVLTLVMYSSYYEEVRATNNLLHGVEDARVFLALLDQFGFALEKHLKSVEYANPAMVGG